MILITQPKHDDFKNKIHIYGLLCETVKTGQFTTNCKGDRVTFYSLGLIPKVIETVLNHLLMDHGSLSHRHDP